MAKAVVKSVDPDSIAEQCGVVPGDIVLKINNETFSDVLDFRFLTSDEYYVIEIQKNDGTIEEIEIFNDLYEQFGCEFENSLMDDAKTCHNKCIFCFMDQLPPNMRETMYFKDDDIRLSFLEGNYVTLTNLTDSEIERICNLRVSPINISVHTTDEALRCKMLNNKFAGKLLSIMERFSKAQIYMNTQIVLCKGINDGENLKKTIFDLAKLYPYVRSISIVPVGLTKFRDGLYPLEPFTKEDSEDIIKSVTAYQNELLSRLGTRLVYLGDEFYVKGECPLPPFESYEDFPQIENGVGLMTSFKRELKEALESSDYKAPKTPKSIATSEIAYNYICENIDMIKEKHPDLKVNVFKIKNNYFGGKITVTGLLCGEDIINQLKGEDLGDFLLLSGSMFKSDCDVLLDDVTKEEIERELNVNVIINDNSGEDFLRALMT